MSDKELIRAAGGTFFRLLRLSGSRLSSSGCFVSDAGLNFLNIRVIAMIIMHVFTQEPVPGVRGVGVEVCVRELTVVL